jgi:hypothetical protein
VTYDIDNLPPGLVAPKVPFNHVEAARMAEALVQQTRAAAERGALNIARVNRALAEINLALMETGMILNRCANNPRLFVLEQRRYGVGVKSIHGTLNEVSEFSRLQDSYRVLYESMCEIQLVAEAAGVME